MSIVSTLWGARSLAWKVTFARWGPWRLSILVAARCSWAVLWSFVHSVVDLIINQVNSISLGCCFRWCINFYQLRNWNMSQWISISRRNQETLSLQSWLERHNILLMLCLFSFQPFLTSNPFFRFWFAAILLPNTISVVRKLHLAFTVIFPLNNTIYFYYYYY